VLIYFAKDWVKIFRDAAAGPKAPGGTVLWMLAAASVPAGVLGLLLNDLAETAFRDPRWIAVNLIVFSALIWRADRRAVANSGETFTLRHAMLIGCAQCLALMPGASRSGMTIMAALFLGYSRPAAARFSFLLGTPVILGAGLLEATKLSAADLNAAFFVGLASAFVSGLLSIGLLLAWLRRRGLAPFLVYRVLLGLGVLAAFA
jgi:undecaprenyl-diphosphatase